MSDFEPYTDSFDELTRFHVRPIGERFPEGQWAQLIEQRRSQRSHTQQPLQGNESSESLPIPPELWSRESLEYAGFTSDAADQIWLRWSSWPIEDEGREVDGGPVTFASMATAYVRGAQRNAWDIHDDIEWFDVLTAYGIRRSTQQAIMASAFRSVRLTASCQHWVLDTIRARFAGLEARFQPSRNRPTTHHSPASQTRRLLPANHRSVQSKSPRLTALWKWTYESTIERCFDARNQINDIGPLLNRGNGDFNSIQSAAYFALDYEVAEQFACYAKRRSPGESVVIVRLLMDNAALLELRSPEKISIFAYPFETFQQLVWLCRRKLSLRDELPEFEHDAKLVIGPICRRPTEALFEMVNCGAIRRADILHTKQNTEAIQYAFMGSQGCEFADDHKFSCTAYTISLQHTERVAITLAWRQAPSRSVLTY